MKRIAFLFLFATSFAIAAVAQPASIKTEKGYLHVHNADPLSFTLDVAGKNVSAKQAAGNPAFEVDGSLIQVLVVNRKEFDAEKTATGKQILYEHQAWELDYLKTIFEQPLKAESSEVTIKDGVALFWSFVRPKFADEFDRDCFLTYSFGEDIVGLSTPLKKTEKIADGQNRLVAVLKTIKFSKTRFDIKKMAEDIKRGVALQGK